MTWSRRTRHYGLALLVVAGFILCALPLRETLTLANFITTALLLVVVVAIRSGTGPAFVTAFASFVCINYFLVAPYYTFWVADPLEVLDLFVFLVVAAIAGQLSARAHKQAQEAQRRAHEQEILYRLTRAFNQLTKNEDVYEALTQVLRRDLLARHVHILPSTSETKPDDNGVHYLLLRGGERIYGTVCAAFDLPLTQPEIDLLNTCVSQAAMALQRIDLAGRASKSKQFEEADRLKTAILHAVSHDLRTPITIIKTSAHNLRQFHNQLPINDEREIIESIEHETDQLDRLVGNLLDMSRLQAGAMMLHCAPNSLEEIAGDVAARVWQLTKRERIRILFPEDMPLVDCDFGLMLQAVTNLVDNSLRYEPPDRLIEIRGEAEEASALLRVVNHGENIPDDLKALVMEPFYRGQGGRTGLGLPIAKGIIEAHRGELWVEDTPNGGTTWGMRLPLKKEGAGKDETEDPGCR